MDTTRPTTTATAGTQANDETQLVTDHLPLVNHVVPVDNVAQILYDRRRPTVGAAPTPAPR